MKRHNEFLYAAENLLRALAPDVEIFREGGNSPHVHCTVDHDNTGRLLTYVITSDAFGVYEGPPTDDGFGDPISYLDLFPPLPRWRVTLRRNIIETAEIVVQAGEADAWAVPMDYEKTITKAWETSDVEVTAEDVQPL